MKYRVVFSNYHSTGLIIPVPDCHVGHKRVFMHMYCGRAITGLRSYDLYTTPTAAEERIHAMLKIQQAMNARRYRYGDVRPNTVRYAEELRPGEPAALVARFLRRGSVDRLGCTLRRQ